MNEDQNKNTIEEIASEVRQINKKIPRGLKSLWNGILTGFGSVVGVALALIIAGYVLNILGVIPAFRTEVESWKQVLQQTKGYK